MKNQMLRDPIISENSYVCFDKFINIIFRNEVLERNFWGIPFVTNPNCSLKKKTEFTWCTNIVGVTKRRRNNWQRCNERICQNITGNMYKLAESPQACWIYFSDEAWFFVQVTETALIFRIQYSDHVVENYKKKIDVLLLIANTTDLPVYFCVLILIEIARHLLQR